MRCFEGMKLPRGPITVRNGPLSGSQCICQDRWLLIGPVIISNSTGLAVEHHEIWRLYPQFPNAGHSFSHTLSG
jgi:hypothetical protein